MWSGIWEGALADALEAIPEGVEPDAQKSLTLYGWRDKGSYILTGATKRQYHLSCAADEFGGVITRDVEHLMDQSLQHRVLLHEAFVAKRTASATWSLVTLYYLAVYLGLAWLRLTGKAITYIGSDEIERLRKLGTGVISKSEKSPGNGTYVIRCMEMDGARRVLILDRLKHNNFHEAFWATLFKDFKDRLTENLDQTAGTETRLFSCLAAQDIAKGTMWPSRLRNLANYRVGFAYDGFLSADGFQFIEAWPSTGFSSVIDIISAAENESMKMASPSVDKMPSAYARFLVYYTALLGNAVEELRAEIWRQRNISTRWQKSREKNLEAWCGKPSKMPWTFG